MCNINKENSVCVCMPESNGQDAEVFGQIVVKPLHVTTKAEKTPQLISSAHRAVDGHSRH